MQKITVKINGMMCGMCESHINDAIRRNFDIKKVSSSHRKGECVILSEDIDKDKLRQVINGTGYTVLGIDQETQQKKHWFSR